MKFVLPIIILFLFGVNLSADWEKVGETGFYNEETGASIAISWEEIECYDDEKCFAVGNMNGPASMKSSDGGESWQHSLLDTASVFQDGEYKPKHRAWSISYPDPSFCIISCDSGYYWLSNDSLKNWEKHRLTESKKQVYEIDFIDNKTGFACIKNNLYKTTDGAQNWQKLSFPIPDELKNKEYEPFISYIQMIDKKTVYIFIGVFKSLGGIGRSYDGGDTWEFSLFENTYISSVNIFFLDQAKGFSNDSYYDFNDERRIRIKMTLDSGKTWQTVVDTVNKNHGSAREIKFYDDKHGYALGSWYNLWYTSDGGYSWEMKDYAHDSTKYHIWRFDIVNTNEVVGLAHPAMQEIYKYTPNSTGIFEDKSLTQVNVFPNPVNRNNLINLEINSKKAITANIEILDLLGNSVLNKSKLNLTKGQNRFVFDEYLPAGVYVVSIFYNNTYISKKLIVK